MTKTITLVIPFLTDDGLIVAIPRPAFLDIKQVAEDEFEAELAFHFHTGPGSYHGQEFVPFAHYLIEATLDDDLIEAFKERLDPLIDDLIERSTQQPEVPAGR